MLYQISADLVVIIHFLFILFACGGGFLVLRQRKWAYIHLPAALWGAAVEIGGWYCPLTPLENWLRHKGGRPVYHNGFIEQYLTPLIYPAGLTRKTQLVLGFALIFLNISVYWWAYHQARYKKQ